MSNSSSTPELLILLVGSNPLPNYLSACALRPAEIALVHTCETEHAKNQLQGELKSALGRDVRFTDAFVADATCATTVRRTIDRVLDAGAKAGDRTDGVWLNYTGGTKVMAVHARMAFAECGGAPEHCTYLDEGSRDIAPRLRHGSGESRGLEDVALDLRTLLALHGIETKRRTALEGEPTEDDARTILCAELCDKGLAKRLHKEKDRLERLKNPSAAFEQPFKPSDHGSEISIQQLPSSRQMDGALYRRWYRFIGGEWLDEWVGAQLCQLTLTPSAKVVVGVNATRRGGQFQLDVAAVRGHRSYFISCTTDATKALCKSKLFEVAVRSRQLGGDLARAALVCLAEDDTVALLRQDIDDVWGASNTTRVFGRSDVVTWSDCRGSQPNRHSLQEWMES